MLGDDTLTKPEVINKIADSEIESRAGNELSSGKKESTTASRSPNSDMDKKEHEEIRKSAIVEFEEPKKFQDIRTYFKVSETQRPLLKEKIFKVKRDNRVVSV